MGISLRWYRPRLYRKTALAVISAICVAAAFGQYAKKAPSNKGPRALGVLEVAANGKAHLIAVTIMIDGKFYDAGAYKADPIPMALQGETVYEAVKTGVPQGLFTVGGAMHAKEGFIADGKWRSTAQLESDKAKAKADAEKKAQVAPEVEQGPPKLKRGRPTSDDDTSSAPPSTPPAEKTPPATAPSGDKTSTDKLAPAASAENDPNRPVLRRQPATETAHEQTKAGGEPDELKGPLQLIPAISDADGPDARPYAYQMKPEEEQARLKKMQAMAADEVKARAEKMPENGTKQKVAAPQFENVQMRVFDLSNSNEPVLVVTANAKVASTARNLEYMTTVVAREDIYGDLHKVFAQTTDNQHLDALPKYELIDAVDADGNGRGELLFRMIWDNGSAFSVYRVIGDRLWPLFEGKPGA
ncbi:MAG: hypothetical protein DMG97_26940 [Acidobacteria bacterium]|nr:MAG: hypothetical protein DMG98_09085 [Acidobacteriota bacterium]PYV67581.1 MAG: hypothetical protein DMG97_26940 [Acidobacteriota bacterium]PYV78535.1 MAG: hypothetical protein DMG96_07565 [Acidobacteriota bacterium]